MLLKPHYLDDKQFQVLQRMLSEDCGNVFIVWWKMGLGKTRIGLAAFEHSGFHDLLLVVRRVSFDDWIAEMEKCGLDYNVYVDTYEAKNHIRLALTKNPKRVLLISGGNLKSVPEHFPKGEFLLVDELYLFSNPQARRSLLLQKISLFCSARVGLSGTLQPAQDSITIYGQCVALRGERSLGVRTSTEFRKRFQVSAKGMYGREYLPRKGADKEMAQLLAPMSDTYFPPSRPTRIQVLACPKTKEQATAVNMLMVNYEYNNRTYKYALQVLNAVNGISNGWWENTIKVGDEVRVTSLSSVPCGKLDKLVALLEELIAAGEKVVVWCAYHNDIEIIRRATLAPKFGYHAVFTGEDEFDLAGWRAGKYNFVLATEAYGASVNHFGAVKYAIYYSINFKLMDLQQSMMRHERKDSPHDGAHYYFLQTKGTYDARAYYLVNQSDKSEKSIVATLRAELEAV
jgi:hypothetical protein